MKFNLNLLFFMLFFSDGFLLNAQHAKAPKKALIFIADQVDGLGIISLCNTELINVNKLFDKTRSLWFKSIHSYQTLRNPPKYDHVFEVLGEKYRNVEYMKTIWQQAMDDFQVIDVFALVHHREGAPWINEEWDVPKRSGKIRLFYYSGCHGGNGGEEIISKYGALATIGHSGRSASPYWAARVFSAWTSGLTLEKVLAQSWQEGINNINSWYFWPIVKQFNYNTPEEVIRESTMQYSCNKELDFTTFTINAPMPMMNSYEYDSGSVLGGAF